MSSVDVDYRSPFRMVVDNQTENGAVDPNKFVHNKNYYVKELWGCRDSLVESALDVASAAIEGVQQEGGFPFRDLPPYGHRQPGSLRG